MGGKNDLADYFVDDDTVEVLRDLSKTFSLVIEDEDEDNVEVRAKPSKMGQTAEELGGLLMEGRFELRRMLGRGGQATVFEAIDVLSGQRVAMKLLHQACDATDAQRFEREVGILTDLQHPHIVRLLEVGTFRDRPWYSMEFVDGQTLSVIQRRLGSLPPSQMLGWAADVLDGLAAAHAQGVMHRDVKPSNILIGREDRRARLLDFGSARITQLRSSLSDAGLALGTPAYMAPEVIRGVDRLTPAIDLYALGVVLYEGITGFRPFDGTQVGALMMKILQEQPAPPSSLAPVAPMVETLVLDLMAKEPRARPSDPARLARQLRTLAQG
ncbi:MAG: serine/threonine protein kinase [Proteobacteria bacterium]|nr:serine/threonine protein kinase [Pseudomonadota bacterium]